MPEEQCVCLLMNTTTGLIQIKKIPRGEAPDYVRKAWFGLFLYCEPILGYPQKPEDVATLSGKPLTERKPQFLVSQEHAMQVIKTVSLPAALWLENAGFPKRDHFFCFNEDEATIVSGVYRQRIIEVADEMQGQPTR
jgi:hypothetical protein